MSLVYLDEMAANIQLFQAYARMMSKFIILESRINHINQTIEQVIYDPFGFSLAPINEGDLLPFVEIQIHNCRQGLLTVDDNPYSCILRIKS